MRISHTRQPSRPTPPSAKERLSALGNVGNRRGNVNSDCEKVRGTFQGNMIFGRWQNLLSVFPSHPILWQKASQQCFSTLKEPTPVFLQSVVVGFDVSSSANVDRSDDCESLAGCADADKGKLIAKASMLLRICAIVHLFSSQQINLNFSRQ